MRIDKIKLRELFGGPGSGNIGHSGRPGEVGGSGEGGGTDKRILDKEKEIINSDTEQHFGLTSSGEIATYGRGKRQRNAWDIKLTPLESSNLKNGGIFTHNHPNSSGNAMLSEEDYDVARNLNLQEMRVVGKNKSLARITRPLEGWPKSSKQFYERKDIKNYFQMFRFVE